MRLTTKGRYGVRAVVNLAAKEQNLPVPISLIAKEEELSPEFNEQIFFKLKKAGLIRSIRGPKGGFVLNQNPSEITIKTILDAVGEPLYPAPCTNPSRNALSPKGRLSPQSCMAEFLRDYSEASFQYQSEGYHREA